MCWWHPLYWVIRRQVHDHAELACDAWAVWAYPDDRRVFADALIDAQVRVAASPLAFQGHQGLCATNAEYRNFERRLNMIMKTEISRTVSRGAAALALVTTALVLPGFSGGGGEEEACTATAYRCVGDVANAASWSA